MINIEKRERLLAGRSVWYSNDEAIRDDLASVFQEVQSQDWSAFSKEDFVSTVSRLFAKLWQIHPFREGNTRTVVMMLTFFVEHHGYYMDQDLLAGSAGYMRDSFVLASLDQFSEYEHLERILMDAICDAPIEYELAPDMEFEHQNFERYQKYQKKPYRPEPHYQRED